MKNNKFNSLVLLFITLILIINYKFLTLFLIVKFEKLKLPVQIAECRN